MKVLVTGANGMLGQDLCPILEDVGCYVIETDVDTLDITNPEMVKTVLCGVRPDMVVHCAAYTNVDGAETDFDTAELINSKGTENIAKVCAEIGATLVYISTDYVFDGQKNEPYTPDDKPNPINNYGLTKFHGEEVVKKHCEKYYIARTSWLYGHYGKNFVETMLEKASAGVQPELARESETSRAVLNETAVASQQSEDAEQSVIAQAEKKASAGVQPEIKVVDDQTGCPTWTVELANGILKLLSKPYGTYHVCGSGETTWYGFAQEIFRLYNKEILRLDLEDYVDFPNHAQDDVLANVGQPIDVPSAPQDDEIQLKPCKTEDFPRPAKRPINSVMDNGKLCRNWKTALKDYMELREV